MLSKTHSLQVFMKMLLQGRHRQRAVIKLFNLTGHHWKVGAPSPPAVRVAERALVDDDAKRRRNVPYVSSYGRV